MRWVAFYCRYWPILVPFGRPKWRLPESYVGEGIIRAIRLAAHWMAW
jgi:hypothetical protein